MKRCAPVFSVLWLLACALSTLAADLPEAKVTLQVLGEDGLPIAGANAGVTFEQFSPNSKPLFKNMNGITDNSGLFSATGGTIIDVHYGAEKTGNYHTFGQPFDFTEKQNGRWLPWNPTLTVILKKIINPVPMYAKQVSAEIPAEAKTVGFDLQEADWVAPHGKGRRADFVFYLTRRFANDQNYEVRLRLTFSNEGDGIQSVFADRHYGSELSLPHNAPLDGYQSVWERTDASVNAAPPRSDQNYFFRVRTQNQTALYGKIHGEIEIAGYGTAKPTVIFIYYLNPDSTRNVEFDPKRNLLRDLKPLEEVRKP